MYRRRIVIEVDLAIKIFLFVQRKTIVDAGIIRRLSVFIQLAIYPLKTILYIAQPRLDSRIPPAGKRQIGIELQAKSIILVDVRKMIHNGIRFVILIRNLHRRVFLQSVEQVEIILAF
ncbi:hypothetical protein D9M72_585880 [compost metagenome]